MRKLFIVSHVLMTCFIGLRKTCVSPIWQFIHLWHLIDRDDYEMSLHSVTLCCKMSSSVMNCHLFHYHSLDNTEGHWIWKIEQHTYNLKRAEKNLRLWRGDGDIGRSTESWHQKGSFDSHQQSSTSLIESTSFNPYLIFDTSPVITSIYCHLSNSLTS